MMKQPMVVKRKIKNPRIPPHLRFLERYPALLSLLDPPIAQAVGKHILRLHTCAVRTSSPVASNAMW